MSYRKLLIVSIGVFCFFAICHFSSFGPLENTHLKIRDLFLRLRGPVPTNSQIAIVAIDDQSIARYGRWPWPRAWIGGLIHRLTEAHVRTIGIDISFLPSQSQAKPVAPNRELIPLLGWLNLHSSQDPIYSNDQLLALAIKKAGNVVLPFYFEFKGSSGEETPAIPRSLSHSAYLLFDDLNRLPSMPLLRGGSVFLPTPALADAAAAIGCVNAYLDRDGVLRNDPAIISYRDQYFPSMGIQLARLYLGLSWAEVKVNSGKSISLGNHVIPIDNRGFVGLNYSGARESFPYVSYKNFMEGKIKPEMLRDKLVLVGVVAAGLHDMWPTPFGPGYPGVEKHATVVANILDERFFVRPDLSGTVEVAFMFLSVLALATVAGSRRSWLLWVSCFILLGLTIGGSYWASTVHHLWFKPLFPALLILSLSLLFQVVRFRSPTAVPQTTKENGLQPLETIVGETSEVSIEGGLSAVGRYQIESELGHGAMGVVYKAVDPKIGRSVAIKTIRLDQTLGAKQLADLKERSLREAQVAGQLSHPGIVTIYDVVEKGGHLYIAMEFIEGQELSHFCTKQTLLKPRQVATIIGHICHALDYAHKAGIVHRDIKPSNIMLPKDGRPKIMDFGITKMFTSDATQTAAMVGTPSYMSPEQIDLEKLDGRSDLFSVGAMFYELLCGQRPFTGPSITAILKKIATEDPPPLGEINPQIHPKLAAVVSRLLAKDPNDRFQSGAEVLSVLKSLLEDPSIWK